MFYDIFYKDVLCVFLKSKVHLRSLNLNVLVSGVSSRSSISAKCRFTSLIAIWAQLHPIGRRRAYTAHVSLPPCTVRGTAAGGVNGKPLEFSLPPLSALSITILSVALKSFLHFGIPSHCHPLFVAGEVGDAILVTRQ